MLSLQLWNSFKFKPTEVFHSKLNSLRIYLQKLLVTNGNRTWRNFLSTEAQIPTESNKLVITSKILCSNIPNDLVERAVVKRMASHGVWWSSSLCHWQIQHNISENTGKNHASGMEIRNSLKWLPRELQESFHLFDDVGDAISAFKALTTHFLNDINLRISDIYVSLVMFAAIKNRSL